MKILWVWVMLATLFCAGKCAERLADVANFKVWVRGICGSVQAHTARSQRAAATTIAPDCCIAGRNEGDGNGVIHGRGRGHATDVRLPLRQQTRNVLIHDLVVSLFNRELCAFGNCERVLFVAVDASPAEDHKAEHIITAHPTAGSLRGQVNGGSPKGYDV